MPYRLACFAASLLACPLIAADTARGITEFQQGRYSAAKQTLQAVVREAPQDQAARAFLALAQAATGGCADALAELGRQFASGTPDLRRLAGLALVQCRLAQNDFAGALPTILELQKLYPGDPDVLYQAARLYMRGFNEVSYEMFQKTPSSYRVAQLSGEIFETQGKFTEAVAEYRKAIAKNPQALNLHVRLGRALLMESHSPEALAAAQKEFAAELVLNPEDAAAEYQLGQILAAQAKPEEALPHWERAVALNPRFPEALLAVAKARLDAKRTTEAITLLEQAVQLQPSNEAARYRLMLAYRNAGQTEKARQQKEELDKLQKPPEGEFTEFLKKLGQPQAAQQP